MNPAELRRLLPYFYVMASEPRVATVRRARLGDLGRLEAIQSAAGSTVREVNLPAAGDGRPVPASSLASYGQTGRAWVAADEHDEPVGFLLADVVDECVYIEQVGVHPAYTGRKIGPMLLDHVDSWAARHKLRAVTLVAFRGVPWNAAYYERLGFRELETTDITPGLAARKAAKATETADPSALVCMRREAASAHADANL
jgi:GNAT superfamily N-acetyltransferase